MKREDLRSLTESHHREREEKRAAHIKEQRAAILRESESRLRAAASEGRSETVVWTVTEFDEHLLAVPSKEDYPNIPLRNLTLSRTHLRGALAELWDKLTRDGLYLSLKMRVKGHSCNSACYVWDLVAQW